VSCACAVVSFCRSHPQATLANHTSFCHSHSKVTPVKHGMCMQHVCVCVCVAVSHSHFHLLSVLAHRCRMGVPCTTYRTGVCICGRAVRRSGGGSYSIHFRSWSLGRRLTSCVIVTVSTHWHLTHRTELDYCSMGSARTSFLPCRAACLHDFWARTGMAASAAFA